MPVSPGRSIRLGVFLRRYPMARIMVLLYMVGRCPACRAHATQGCLHAWVLLVLLTYTPELHQPSHHGAPDAPH